MGEPDLISLFVAPLEDAGIRYMISGSVAAIHYGEPRATLDINAVILIGVQQLEALADLFPAPEYYLPPREVLMVEINRESRGHFNVIHSASGLKADLYPSRTHPYFGWAVANLKIVEIDGRAIRFAPAEYVILWKLEFLREGGGEKHRDDIRSMLKVQGEKIDQSLLREAAEKLGLGALWLEVALDGET